MRYSWGAWALLLLVCSGCAATTVKRNPGPRDRGFRFYRPKPFLLIQPIIQARAHKPGMYSVELQYLPDFSEEYSLHVRTGLGINKTNAKFENGWNLTYLSVDVDSQTAENIGAVTELLKSIKTFIPTGAEDRFVIEGSNIPIGYYEAVVSGNRRDGRRLYGWRHVGLMPFHACPVEMSGSQAHHCQSDEIYALMMEGSQMVFRRIIPNVGTIVESATTEAPQNPGKDDR